MPDMVVGLALVEFFGELQQLFLVFFVLLFLPLALGALAKALLECIKRLLALFCGDFTGGLAIEIEALVAAGYGFQVFC